MKTKTKEQLRAEIFTLESECNVLKHNYKFMQKFAFDILSTLEETVRTTIIHSPEKYDSLAWFITEFFGYLKRRTELDAEKLGYDEYFADMGFDEATVTMIKKRIPVLFEISKMTQEGKSQEEIRKFIDKQKKAEGRG